ncbi:cystathionine gamma-synthase [Tersicoccus phoenicis]|uniref:homocysteine desulfhydrase n=1 Tax=Tersicoccus phoenicis TaxID=554083 RepID=A0A1R1L7J5_9MICC|nr:aminotransferase class I/II-fold pyridoxal phosphate-dependent enzyme [Tersicoccus phoenicis]OMH23502.1 cystathionine gamma-synthase [Tersicoccus phoenicis]
MTDRTPQPLPEEPQRPATPAEEGSGKDGHPAFAPDTLVVAAGRPGRVEEAPVNPPIVLSSTYHSVGPVQPGRRSYGRSENPSWEPFEEALGQLEHASLPALLFSSGMAAVDAALSLLPPGGTLVIPRHSYQGSLVAAHEAESRGQLSVVEVDVADTAAVIAALPGAAMLWLESPTNPMMEIAEIAVLTRAAHDAGALVVADNTFCTPLLQRPLDLDVDVVVHSVTKYLAGHSDVILGAVVTSDVELRARLWRTRTTRGAIAGSVEAWLALRGLRTLAIRLERSEATARLLAARLAEHPAVSRVRYPGLPDDPGHARAETQMGGFGSILAFEVAAGTFAAEQLTERVRLWIPATSLGGVESLIERRRRHPTEALTVPGNLLRLSVGIENAEDLWADLVQALA